MYHAVLAVVTCIAAVFLQGCEPPCKMSDKCTSPDVGGGKDCCVCEKVVECLTCEVGYYGKGMGIVSNQCNVDGTDYGKVTQYTCEKAEGDMTKCTSDDGKGGTDCIATSDPDMTCETGYSAKALGEWGICGSLFKARYYTCIADSN